jgi:RNA polymerase sigma-70 factor (ECF subfamily)
MRPELSQAIELLKTGLPEDIERALGLMQSTVYSFSMKVCGHAEDAEDTSQEVLFRSLPYLAKIEDPRALAVWLYTVTRNRCWRMRRKSAHAPQQMLSLDELMPDAQELQRLLADAAPGPEDRVLNSEQNALLQEAVLRLPPALRMVLVLHDMEELTTEEVAHILDLQPGTVRVRLHRARLQMRKEMKALEAPSPTATEAGMRPRRVSATQRNADCRNIFANLSEYLDGRVEPLSCEQMRRHIETCPSCVAFLRDLRAAIDRCRQFDASCDPAVARRLRSALTREYLRMIGLPSPSHIS